MFEADRVYSATNPTTGKFGWYFQVREGECGPYQSKEAAENMLKEYIAQCIEEGNSGGRQKKLELDAKDKVINNEKKRKIDFQGKISWHD